MPVFKYRAVDKSGNRKEGELDVRDEQDLKQQLKTMGFTMLSAEKKGGMSLGGKKIGGPKKAKALGGKPNTKDIAIISRQLAVMISAGVSLLRAVTVLGQQAEKTSIKEMLNSIKDDLSQGVPLSGALAKFPKSFDKMFVSMIRAGEASGALEEVLKKLATFGEKSEELKGKVKGAMTYPVIVLAICGIVVTILLVFVIPRFTKMFTDAGMKLPGLTQFLVDVSSFLAGPGGIVVLGAVIAGGYSFKKFADTDKGKRAIDIFLLKAPLFGNLTRKMAVSRFTGTMATLLNSGVPILQAFDIVADTVGNIIVAEAILVAKGSIKEGNTIAKPLIESGQFPLMVTQMIEIGEEAGAITEMLDKITDFYDREVNDAVESLVAAMEPLTIVLMAGVVGTIVVALMLPMFSMGDLAG